MIVSDGSDANVRVIAPRRQRLYNELLMADFVMKLAKDRRGKEEGNKSEVR